MLEPWRVFWDSHSGWIQNVISGAIGSILAAIIMFIFKLLQRFIRWKINRQKPILEAEFPFVTVKRNKLGQELAVKGTNLTCYKNPFVPKEVKFVYKSSAPESARRRIHIGGAEIGKTRAAYEWILEITKNEPDSDILIAKSESMPDLINQKNMPPLAGMVVLFYDDINKSLLKELEKEHHEGGVNILSPLERFEKNINFLEERCTNLYIVCTARWERDDSVKSIENPQKIWKTFNILTLEDAPSDDEFSMIKGLAESLNVDITDDVIKKMTKENNGHSYENTVVFMKNRQKVTDDDLDDYKKQASKRWEDETFYRLYHKNPLLAQIIGAMYMLKFKPGLPMYRRFILTSAKIVTNGFFKELRLRKALRLLCRHDFSLKDDIVSCYDYQLEIEGKRIPSPDACLNLLYKRRHRLSENERNSLADWFFNKGLGFYDQNEFEFSAREWEKSVLLKPDYSEAYYNWGFALHELAELKHDELLYEESISKYKKAAEINPDDSKAYNNWGLALSKLAKLKHDESLYQESINKYKKAVEINPDDSKAYYNWGLVLYDLAKLKHDESLYQESINKYKKATEINPGYLQAYGNMATSYAQMKRSEEACESLDRAVSINPEVVELVRNSSAFDPIRNDPVFQQWLQKHSKPKGDDR